MTTPRCPGRGGSRWPRVRGKRPRKAAAGPAGYSLRSPLCDESRIDMRPLKSPAAQAYSQQSKIPEHDGAAGGREADEMNQVERREPPQRLAQRGSELRRFDGLRDLEERHYASVARTRVN